MSFLDIQQQCARLGIGRKCTWTIISSTGSFDIMMEEESCCGSDRPKRNAVLEDLLPPKD
jgi:hypothetical protein